MKHVLTHFSGLTLYQVLSAATIVAKHTSALCNACRLASSKTPNPVAKRQFVQSAKEVANTTANLVKSIKVSTLRFSPSKRKQWVLVICLFINPAMCAVSTDTGKCRFTGSGILLYRLWMEHLTMRTERSVRPPLVLL